MNYLHKIVSCTNCRFLIKPRYDHKISYRCRLYKYICPQTNTIKYDYVHRVRNDDFKCGIDGKNYLINIKDIF